MSFAYGAYALLSITMFVVSASTLWWMLHDWRAALSPAAELRSPSRHRPVSFSLLVPARHEQTVLGDTLARLAQFDHPSFEILAVVGHDDPDTRAVAESAALDYPGLISVVVDHSWPKNKPKALNSGLQHCRGDYVGVFDAEDEVASDLLGNVERLVGYSGADIVQAGVQLVDIHSHWYSLRNCLEYLFWFRSRMHAHSRHGVVPLGGNTVFIRRELLVSAGGWDPECLAEDCEIGIRLTAAGSRTAVLFDPHLATREETPPSLASFFRQRTRWSQGFLQVLRKGEWHGFDRFGQRQLARYLLAYPFLQAASAIFVPLSIAMIVLAKPPLSLSLLAFLPLSSMLVTVVIEMVALHELCRDFYLRVRTRDYVLLVVSTIPYQLILALAALRGALRELRGVRAWEKTAHLGSHRSRGVAEAAAP